GLACISHLAGVAAGRWLFFAEAEHTVGLYYQT
ncbi:MAG: dibenzothiophene desulfurase, partial [Pseudomonadota bacterium]